MNHQHSIETVVGMNGHNTLLTPISGANGHNTLLTPISIASSPGLHILRGWKTKAWYTLFVHAYNFNQILLNCLFTVTKWPMVLTTCSLSEGPSFPKCTSYAPQTLCLKNTTHKKTAMISDGGYLWWELVPPMERTAIICIVKL